MPFEQKHDAATRAAAAARVIQRRATNPTDRHVLRVVAEEFGVGEQFLREWVEEATAGDEKPAKRSRRPRFSPVVTSKIEPMVEQDVAADVEPEPAPAAVEPATTPASVGPAPAPAAVTPEPEVVPPPASEDEPEPQPEPEPQSQPEHETSERVALLEAEVASLRMGNEALKEAMRVVLRD